MNKIYIAATRQHVGKTTTTLGLVHALKHMGLDVGYCKPVGQKALSVGDSMADKDTVLFADYMQFDTLPELHSPVIVGAGATTRFLDSPKEVNFANKVLKASKILQQRHDVVVYEGTGHPGVGAVVNLSNARVAELLGAGVIMVVEAGIGSTIDSIELNLSLFMERKVPILGIIINKTIPSKIDKVEKYVGKWLALKNIPLLGVIPYEEELALPLMSTIVRAIGGEVICNDNKLNKRIDDIIAGSLFAKEDIKGSKNILLVVSISRLDDALHRIKMVSRTLGHNPETTNHLAGVIISGQGDIKEEHQEYFNQFSIPVVRSKIDTYESVIKISKIEVKINTKTPWKVKKAVSLFKEHVRLDFIEKLASSGNYKHSKNL